MIEQHKSHQKPGVNSGVPLMVEDRVGVSKRQQYDVSYPSV